MVPAAVVVLEALTLTANGKLDRARLPAPTVDRPSREAAERPRTPHERQVADAWAEVLHRDDIGLHDNFFDLGGNSLSAMRMVARIEQAGGRTVRPAAVFQAPTVEQLAALLSEEDATGDASPLVTLRGTGAGAPVFLVHPIGGNWARTGPSTAWSRAASAATRCHATASRPWQPPTWPPCRKPPPTGPSSSRAGRWEVPSPWRWPGSSSGRQIGLSRW
jgi:acyl carrier protein